MNTLGLLLIKLKVFLLHLQNPKEPWQTMISHKKREAIPGLKNAVFLFIYQIVSLLSFIVRLLLLRCIKERLWDNVMIFQLSLVSPTHHRMNCAPNSGIHLSACGEFTQNLFWIRPILYTATFLSAVLMPRQAIPSASYSLACL